MKEFLIKFFASGFGFGFYIPFIPGAWGILLGTILSILINNWPIFLKILFTFGFLILAIYISGEAEKFIAKGKDPHCIVIDETAGILIASIWFDIYSRINLFAITIPLFVVIYFLFALFDSIKIIPIKEIAKLPGGWGIVLDDVVAGLYTIIILLIILNF